MGLSRYQVDRIKRMAMDRVQLTLYNNSLLDRKMDEYYLAVETGGDLSVRSMTALIHNGLRTEEEIVKYINQNNLEPVEALMQLKHIGKRSAEEIFNFLKIKGLC